MEQLQSLLGHMATELRRFEIELEEAKATSPDHKTTLEPTDRARRTTLRLAAAANPSSLCSCCELAIFIKTASHARKRHKARGIFLARPAYLFEQCRRLLQSAHLQVIGAPNLYTDDTRAVDVLCFSLLPSAASGETRNIARLDGIDMHSDGQAHGMSNAVG